MSQSQDIGDLIDPEADDPTEPEVTDPEDPNYVEPAVEAVRVLEGDRR